MEILDLVSTPEKSAAFQVMKQLRDDLSEEQYGSLLERMEEEGYRMCGVIDQDRLVAVAGFAVLHNFYNKRHLWLYDLVTDSSLRSRGYGETLLAHIEWIARAERCSCVVLSSGIARIDAHRFYERNDYSKVSVVFRKRI